MRLPDPDQLILDLFEAMFAPFQRRGVPLPALQSVTEFGPCVGCLAVGLASLGAVSSWLAHIWFMMACAAAAYGISMRSSLMADARSWSDAQARRYRADALAFREEAAWLRNVKILFAVGLATCCAIKALALGPFAPATLLLAAYAFEAICFLAMDAGKCVMPRDPDLRDRVGEPGLA